MPELAEKEIELFSEKIHKSFYHYFSHRLSMFLCGASINAPHSFRRNFAEYIAKQYKYSIDIIYPEDIFDELLYGSARNNLLSLEVLLGNSVDSIVIIPESAGALTEFGAFTHDDKLRQKSIGIIDSEFRRDKSFINQGPVKLIKQVDRSHIIYVDKKDLHSVNSCFISAIKAAYAIKKSHSSTSKDVSLLKLEYFLLPAIYLLEPIPLEVIKAMVKVVTNGDKNSSLATVASLSIMTKKKYIYKNVDGEFLLTKTGKEYFKNLIEPGNRSENAEERRELDRLRLEVFAWKYRKKKLKL